MKALYLDPGFEKQIRMLRRAGKKAAIAVDKADRIIARLRGGESVPEEIGSMTKHGELRIKGVVKYDLGSGYRLVTCKQGLRIFLLFVGTHDDCHHYIENNRELSIDQIKDRCRKIPVEIAENNPGPVRMAAEEAEYDPLAHVTEKEMRLIFRGLVDSICRGEVGPEHHNGLP